MSHRVAGFRSTTSQIVFVFGKIAFALPEVPVIIGTRISLSCHSGLPPDFLNWLGSWIKGKAIPTSCQLALFGIDHKEKARYDLKSCSIASIEFPTLDAALPQPARLKVTLQAISVTQLLGGQAAQPTFFPPKMWRCSDFKLLLTDVETSKVSHIDPICVVSPGLLPHLNVQVASVLAPSWSGWKNKGTSVPGSIRYFFADLKSILLTLSFTAKLVSIPSLPQGLQFPAEILVTAPGLKVG